MGRTEVIAIIGGGASGALTALHMRESVGGLGRVVVIEPRSSLGGGVAYSTGDSRHLLNVSANHLSAWSDDPSHFAKWASGRGVAAPSGFLPRSAYGAYLSSLTADVEHIRASVVDVSPWGGKVSVGLSTGDRFSADRIVLAPGSSPSTWPDGVDHCDRRFIRDPWRSGALRGVRKGLPVLLVGSGLTAVDVSLSLQAAGHGSIIAASRHGLLPAAHREQTVKHRELRPPRDVRSLSELLTWARAGATELGGWVPLFEELRPHIDGVWQSLPASEQERFLRLAYRRFEVLRHRMAPEVARDIGEMRRSGALTVMAGRVAAVRQRRSHIDVQVGGQSLCVGAVVNCTGPSRNIGETTHPLIRSLLARGIAKPGPHALGIDSDPRGCLPGTDSKLWLVGPLRRGITWETTAIPEIREQARTVAACSSELFEKVGA
jgi:uncharacterized NAD(P)/FAD-binding protein YdhS